MNHLKWCKEIKNNYSKRHDTILVKVVSELKHHCHEILVNKTIRGSFREFTEESEHRSELNLKDVQGLQILTMKAAGTLCIVCLPLKEHIS